MSNPKVVFIDNPFFAVNNKDNNFLLYKGKDKNNKRVFKKCKDKADYSTQAKKYLFGVNGFFEYSRNDKKANISLLDYDKNNNLFGYMLGSKKEMSIMELNNMKRDKMMMDKTGEYMTDAEANKKNFYWSKLFDQSNIHLNVLSFNKDYVDNNIGIEKLHKELTTKIMPTFLKKCGHQNPNKTMDWVVALHSAVDRNNYHFHIGFIEKKESYLGTDNKLHYKQRLNLNDDELNFMKRQTVLSIERAKVFTPALIKLNNNLEEYKKYFNLTDRSFTLKNIKDIELEYKILRLGYLLKKVRENSKYIKYNSLPKNEVGKEIRYLTKDIKEKILMDKDILISQKEINRSIDEINDIFLQIDKENNISNIGFENAIDNKLVKDKLEKYDNYVLNAIVNHSLYIYNNRFSSNTNITFNDLINEAILITYINQNKKKKNKINLLEKSFNNVFYNKKEITQVFNRLKYNQDQVAKQFYEMLSDNGKDLYK